MVTLSLLITRTRSFSNGKAKHHPPHHHLHDSISLLYIHLPSTLVNASLLHFLLFLLTPLPLTHSIHLSLSLMMTNSKDKTPATCFSSVLRRLLCAGGLPTHPSSDTDNPEGQTRLSTTNLSSKHQPSSPTRSTIPPGIIARLMGLDSIPNSSYHATIMRKSKSVGSVDFLPNFERLKQPHHQRALSFREVPTFLQTSHNHGKVDHVMSLTPIEEKSKNLNKNKNKKVQSQKQNLKVKGDQERVSCVQGKCKSRKKKLVIDDGFPEEQKKWKSRKRAYNKYNHPLPKMGKHDRRAKKKVILKRRESEYSEEYCINVLMEVCRLTMDEMNGSVWVGDNLQDISYEIGQEILQVLVYEMIDELLM